ncbi:ATP-binding protein [Hydrogenimonas sp.]
MCGRVLETSAWNENEVKVDRRLSSESGKRAIRNLTLYRVFEPFYRVGESGNGSVEGHGLGLSIVGWIVRLHDAAIEVGDSTEGTEFLVTFPVETIRQNS